MADWLGPEEWQAVALSLKVSFWATLGSLPLGILTAYALARWSFPGKLILNGLVHLPLVLPPVVTGYLLLLGFGRNGPVGSLLAEIGIVFAFRWTGAALAAAIMAFPLMVRAIRLSIEAVDVKLEQAGATLGASRPWIFATLTLPMILPGILAGAILAFAKAMGEFGATITFVSNIPGQTRTIPTAIYAFLQVPGGETAAMKLVLVSVVVAMGALLLSEVGSRRASGGCSRSSCATPIRASRSTRASPRRPASRCSSGARGRARPPSSRRWRGCSPRMRGGSRSTGGCCLTPPAASDCHRAAAAWAISSRKGGSFRT